VFKTLRGRPVLGGGGITPDYIVRSDTVTLLTRELRRHNLFWKVTEEYLARHRAELEHRYGSNYWSFVREFRLRRTALPAAPYPAAGSRRAVERPKTSRRTATTSPPS
jgi:hypothetical protein